MQSNNISFVYGFKCVDDIPYFDKLPAASQVDIESDIVEVIYESFVIPGDEDYLSARLLALKGLHRAFYWSAAQAVEKYLKAFLLMNGFSVNEKKLNGHPIIKLYEKALLAEKQLEVDTEPHPDIIIKTESPEILKKKISVNDFLINLQCYGNPDNRYNASGVTFNTNYLFALDSFVYSLRKNIGVPDIFESLRDMDQEMINVFTNYNPWFCAKSYTKLKSIPNDKFKFKVSISNTKLDILTSKHPPSHSVYVLQWLKKKMKLPRNISTK